MIGKEFLITAMKRVKYYKDPGDKTFEQLADKDFHSIQQPIKQHCSFLSAYGR